jgi:hypothetical protein
VRHPGSGARSRRREAVGRRADHARHIDRDLHLADLRKWIIGPGIIVQGQRALVGGEVIGAQPVLPHDDRIVGNAAHLLDKTGQMKRDLRIGRLIGGIRGRYRLRLAKPVDLHHPGHDRTAHTLPDKSCGKAARKGERTEESQPPVLRLHPRRTDALVPDLCGALIGGHGLQAFAVMHGWSSEHRFNPFLKHQPRSQPRRHHLRAKYAPRRSRRGSSSGGFSCWPPMLAGQKARKHDLRRQAHRR